MNIIVCYTRCWDCQFEHCPGGPHTWMDSEDAEHRYGTPAPASAVLATTQPCACWCYPMPKTAYRWRQAQRDRRASPSRLQRMRVEYHRRQK